MHDAAFEQKLRSFIRRHQLWNEGDRLLLAVSGGCDSVVMLHALHRLGYTISAAHCNFGLRGEESDSDQHFVEQLCREMGVPCYARHFDTLNFARERGLSVQMSARHLRYEWFGTLLKAHGYDRLCTAHHADDQAETLLLNLVLQRGMRSMAGIPVRRGQIVRPLLQFTRAEIEAWALQHRIAWRHDRSNDESEYLRNMIRLQVMPLLRQINPSFAVQAPALAREQAGICVLADEELARLTAGITENRGDITYLNDAVLREHPARFTLYRHLLQPFGFSAAQVEGLLQSDMRPGSTFISTSHTLTADRGRLLIELREKAEEAQYFRIHEPVTRLEVPGGSFTLHLLAAGINPPESHSPDTARLDFDKLVFPLSLRHWQAGDRFMPLGMDHFRKVSDYFTDRKIALPEKKRKWLLLNEDQIVWIAGERIDQRYRITENTRHILQIEWHEQHS